MRTSIALLCLTLVVAAALPASAAAKKSAEPAKSSASKKSAEPAKGADSKKSAEPSKTTTPATPANGFTGKQGNIPKVVVSGWGAGDDLFLLAQKTVFHSPDRGATWEARELKTDGRVIWGSSVDDVWVFGTARAQSKDRGRTWEISKPFGDGVDIYAAWGPSAKEIFAVGEGDKARIFYSSDAGKTFKAQLAPIKYSRFFSIVGHGKEVYAGGEEGETEAQSPVLVLTTDKGKTWKRVTPPKVKGDQEGVKGMCFTGTDKMVLAMKHDVFLSKDHAKSWKSIHVVNEEILSVACLGQEIFIAGKSKAFHHSLDEGATWDEKELQSLYVDNLRTPLQTIFITDVGDVYVGGGGVSSDKTGSLFRRAK
jgi:photosystem II stability/assembly factor-like uncharacterized protein